MFDELLAKIVANADYAAKLTVFQVREARQKMLRGVGFALVALALVVQVAAFVSSPKSQAAASPNDLIPGGVSSLSTLVSRCNSNYHQIKTIYGWYGVSCADIGKGKVVSLKSTSYSDRLYSVGHLPYGLPGETPVTVAGSTLYWRLLHGWDTGKFSTYKAVQMKAVSGKTFFILFQCGNLVSIGFPSHYMPPKPPKKTQPPALCPYNSNLAASSPLCKPCSASSSQFDTASCLSYSKAASNMTRDIPNANNTTAQAGDVIQYTLTVKNSGAAASTGFVVQENISDVLDYASLANLNGGSLSGDGVLSWPAETVPAKGSIQKQFTVQVKNPIPSSAPGNDDPQAFNYVMTNVYGNTININVAQPVVVTAAKTATTSLPNTGPGAGVIVMGVVAVLAGYFYFRSRLMLKESHIAQTLQLQEGAGRYE
jgi:uncharacterized repeat protein (TIGR01451 family)